MIELKGLSAGYGRQVVLSGVSMELTPGKVLALLGPNGCGKSTLLKTILGLQPKLAGEILVDGTPSDQITPWVMVPVLSSTTVSMLWAVSNASADFIKMPFVAPLPVPTMIAVGVATQNEVRENSNILTTHQRGSKVRNNLFE